MDPTDSPYCLFTGSLSEEDGRYIIEVPDNEVEMGTLTEGTTYRIGVFPGPEDQQSRAPTAGTPTSEDPRGDGQAGRASQPGRAGQGEAPTPPVREGERRTVTIESLGEQGDGIAKVERGFVIIVPGADVGDEVVVEIDSVKQNLAFASVIESTA